MDYHDRLSLGSLPDHQRKHYWTVYKVIVEKYVQARREEVQEQVREDVLDSMVDIYLTETETIWLLDIPSVSVSEDSEDAETVKERNNAYTELCKNRQGNDKYVERSMQTFNGAPKTKEVQCDSIAMVDKAVMSTLWDMYDSFSNKSDASGNTVVSDQGNKADVPDSSSSMRDLNPKGPEQSMSMVSISSTVSGSSAQLEKMACVLLVEEEPDHELILQSDKFKQDLAVMERVILANIFQPKLAAFYPPSISRRRVVLLVSAPVREVQEACMGLQQIQNDHYDREICMDLLPPHNGHFVEQGSVGRVQAWTSP
ncbi:unnamed protein product [Leuciscus chuanchicus]